MLESFSSDQTPVSTQVRLCSNDFRKRGDPGWQAVGRILEAVDLVVLCPKGSRQGLEVAATCAMVGPVIEISELSSPEVDESNTDCPSAWFHRASMI